MKQMTKYVSDAGRMFDTPAEAELDDKRYALIEALTASNMDWREFGADEVADWMLGNQDILLKLLSEPCPE